MNSNQSTTTAEAIEPIGTPATTNTATEPTLVLSKEQDRGARAVELAIECFAMHLGLFAMELEPTLPGITDRLESALMQFSRNAGLPTGVIDLERELMGGYARGVNVSTKDNN